MMNDETQKTELKHGEHGGHGEKTIGVPEFLSSRFNLEIGKSGENE
jgi:hypothetical protein